MGSPLSDVYGTLLVVRPPVPVTVNKAGANYKSEVPHLSYSPRRAFDEWVRICEAITACGGDALFDFEDEDEPFLAAGDLRVAADGTVTPIDSNERLGHLDDVLTGRVFTANGPWVVKDGADLRAVLPNMLAHRSQELPYYENLLELVASFGAYDLEFVPNPHRWEGMADVAVIGDHVVLTYAVPGHYDQGVSPKSERSTRDGVAFAAEQAGVPESQRIYAELVYPHFHGDTVHFGARPRGGGATLVHYAGGLWGDGAARLRGALGAERILPIERDDAIDQYAGNSRQVASGVLVPDGVSAGFERALAGLGLDVHRVPLFELFGKAGGGPACATLYLPAGIELPPKSPIRFSARREAVASRRARLAERVVVDPGYFAGKQRG